MALAGSLSGSQVVSQATQKSNRLSIPSQLPSGVSGTATSPQVRQVCNATQTSAAILVELLDTDRLFLLQLKGNFCGSTKRLVRQQQQRAAHRPQLAVKAAGQQITVGVQISSRAQQFAQLLVD